MVVEALDNAASVRC
uniref:Uncharacterized protein n=1 Tax=Anguilla anguilla TaxID=7936 RepID=A0A0E9VC12_ANGAN